MVSVPTALHPVLTGVHTFYPWIVEVAALTVGLLFSVAMTYRFLKMIYFSSRNVFGVLTRHLRALFRAAVFVGLGEVLYFATRLFAVFSPRFNEFTLLFDLAALTVMVATVLFAIPLLQTLHTIPHVYGE